MLKTVLFAFILSALPCAAGNVLAASKGADLPPGTQLPAGVSPAAADLMRATLLNNKESYVLPCRVTGSPVVSSKNGKLFRSGAGTFRLSGMSLPDNLSGNVTLEGWIKRGDTIYTDDEYRASGAYPELRVDKIVPTPAPYTWRAPGQQYSVRFSDSGGKYSARSVRWGGGSTVRWEGASINPSLLNKVYVVKKPIPEWHPSLSHTLLFFTFKDGGLVNASDRKPAKGLAVSIEARWRDDASMSLETAFSRTFNIAWVVSTMDDYIERNCGDSGGTDNKLYPFELRLSQEQKTALLLRALRLASEEREGEFYNGRSNNCTVSMIRIINGVLPAGGRIVMFENGANELPDRVEQSLSRFLSPGLPPITPENYRNQSAWPQ